ncbi:hypothetical protein [Cupriavidus sp. IDO]|uniref:hypothetical protein n=1 Tax=Cupriavidus sp. IDO TaxID=1539142 RepID=UPI000579521A|nr:hypothetical protein [Cupriavidus sp. IDO]KWR88785.1 hypothetical protein RM96_17885 [Cupriavidus sp. IDO]
MTEMMKAGEYHLFFWGEINNDGLATAKFGPERNYWFATPEDRAIFKAEVSLFAKAAGQIVCFSESDGPLAMKRTIAKMTLVYDGQRYPYEYDFGYGYEAYGAEYMFFDGNYGCDCNLSLFLQRAYPDAGIPELKCGDAIEVDDFEIEYRD